MEKEIHLRALEPEDLDFLYEMENDESLPTGAFGLHYHIFG